MNDEQECWQDIVEEAGITVGLVLGVVMVYLAAITMAMI